MAEDEMVGWHHQLKMSIEMSVIESVMPSNRLMLCHSLLLLPSVFPKIRVFSSESALRIRWPKYWSFSFSISPSSEYSELISFKMDWFDLFAVKETFKSLLQEDLEGSGGEGGGRGDWDGEHM